MEENASCLLYLLHLLQREKAFGFQQYGTQERISGEVQLESKSYDKCKRQSRHILPFCVVFLVSLQTRHYEQYATNFLLLENDKDLDFYGSKCHKMLPLDQQYDTRTILNKKSNFPNNFCKSIPLKSAPTGCPKKRVTLFVNPGLIKM